MRRDPIRIAHAAAHRLGSVPGSAAHDDMISAATFGVWRFDEAHPDAPESLRLQVAKRRAFDALRAFHHQAGRRVERNRYTHVPLDDHVLSTVDPDPPLTAAEVLDLRPRLANERDRQMILAWLDGATLATVGAQFGVSEPRVWQIVNRWAHAA